MATFARKTFDAAGYAAGRPTIPSTVVAAVLRRAQVSARPAPRTALDLGCGPGQLARTLAGMKDGSSGQPLFARVRGVDPSAGMVETARSIEPHTAVDYAIGTAEDAEAWAEPTEFDLIVCVQAAHWFDQSRAYPQLARILKPGGTLAYLGYGEFYLPDRPEATELIRSTMQTELRDFWEAGRRHVDSELDSIPFPTAADGPWDASSFHRAKWIDDPQQTPAYAPPRSSDVQVDERNPAALDRQWTRTQLQSYINSFSALHTYQERHGPGRAAEFAAQVCRAAGLAEDDTSTAVTVRWPVTTLTMRKRA